jgi:hypothetical protein
MAEFYLCEETLKEVVHTSTCLVWQRFEGNYKGPYESAQDAHDAADSLLKSDVASYHTCVREAGAAKDISPAMGTLNDSLKKTG